jgi:hypothetical protein
MSRLVDATAKAVLDGAPAESWQELRVQLNAAGSDSNALAHLPAEISPAPPKKDPPELSAIEA